jgi:ribokinase
MASTDPTVTVVGSYNVGLTMQIDDFPAPGETVIGRNFAEGPGGKGSNQAIAAARLGAESQFVGRIGDDQYGEDALALWKREGVTIDNIDRDPNVHTGVGFVIVDENGKNEITVAPGANEHLSRSDVREADNAIESASTLLVQLEIGDDPIQTAVETADAADVNVVCNPAPARELPRSILKHVDYLTPNEHEARMLAGTDGDERDETVARELLNLGVETVVLTRGSAGALLVSDDSIEQVDAPSVEAVDTTGAGDAFNGAFAVALAEGHDDLEAVRFACAAGAFSVMESEVVPGLPNRAAVVDLVERIR